MNVGTPHLEGVSGVPQHHLVWPWDRLASLVAQPRMPRNARFYLTLQVARGVTALNYVAHGATQKKYADQMANYSPVRIVLPFLQEIYAPRFLGASSAQVKKSVNIPTLMFVNHAMARVQNSALLCLDASGVPRQIPATLTESAIGATTAVWETPLTVAMILSLLASGVLLIFPVKWQRKILYVIAVTIQLTPSLAMTLPAATGASRRENAWH
ncbi:hypothetical protein Pelo_12955 [Pelomyxa schiedti]|nr:hypothetical protein Pelo_12955 [Pelomyxa schiedti]